MFARFDLKILKIRLLLISRNYCRMIRSRHNVTDLLTDAQLQTLNGSRLSRKRPPMNFKNFAHALGFGHSAANRMGAQKASKRRLVFNPLEYELEKRQLLATFNYNSLTGRLLVETDQNSETLSIISTSNSGDYTLTTTGAWSGSSSADVGSSGTSLFVNSTASISLIQITSNAANSGSAFYFGTSSGNYVDDLTVNFTNSTSGQISVANATSFINGSILNLTTAGNQISVSSRLTSNSTGSLNLTGRNIVVTGNITTAAGSISLIGNNGSYQSGSYDGVNISGSGVNVNTTSGNITIDGRGASNSTNYGVNIGGTLKTGGTGFIYITGVSGNGTSGFSQGIAISSPVTTANGNITVYGTSESAGYGATGVCLTSLANISSTGTGSVNITGSSLNASGDARGVMAITGGNNLFATANTGQLTINGTANSTGSGATGVCFTSGSPISATGSGNIIISGTALNAADSAIGVRAGTININSGTLTITGTSNGVGAGSVGINLIANITNSGAGNVNLTGSTPGNTSAGIGINHSDSSTRIYSNGGLITLTANSLNLTGTVNATTAGNVLIQTLGAGVNLGNGTDTSANLGLSSVEIGNITANLLTIGNGTTGNIAVTAAISRPANGSLTLVANTTSSCISVGAALSVTGSGGLSLTGRNIVVTGNITSTAGSISLIGNNGSYQSGTFDGVRINGSTVNVNTTSGNITIDGRAGANTINSGVNLTSSKVQAGGSGCVTITGVSGNGTGSAGNMVAGVYGFGASVTTSNGSVTVNGTSWGSTGTASKGVILQASANFSATGTGNVTITGTAANGTTLAEGIYIYDSNVTTSTGSLNVNGTSCGTGTGSIGVSMTRSSSTSFNISATGAGNVTITGITPRNLSTDSGINMGGGFRVKSNGGLIILTANQIGYYTNANATTAGNVIIQPIGNGTLINLGANSTNTTLGISNETINSIVARTLTIGSVTTGNIAISANISWPTNLTLISGSMISGIQNANTLTQGNSNITSTGLLTVSSMSYSIGITANSPVSYGTTVLLTATLTHSGSSFNSGTISFYNNGSLLGTGNVSGDVATYSWAGAGAATYSNITASGNVASAAFYGSNTANVTVNPYSLTVTANSQNKAYGASVPTLTYTNSTLVNGDTASVFTGNLTTTGLANSGVGNYSITQGNLSAGANYSISYISANLAVTPYGISVTANNQTKAYGAAVPTLTYTNSPLVNGDSASIFSGNLATSATANSPAGFYPITIGSLATNSNYSISSFTNGTLSEAEEISTVVTTSTDSTDPYDNVVSLREAISYGTTLTGNQAVTFSSGIFTSNLSTITLTQGVLTINDNTGLISIQGPSAASGNSLTITGNNASGIFKVLSDATISNMTLTNGTGANGTSPNIQGGAIYSSTTLVLSNVSINNSTANYGSAIYQSGGVLNVNSSHISNSIYVVNSGDLIISGAQSVVLPQITACSLSVNISSGSITQAAGTNIQVSGTASFVSSGEVILANSSNDFATLDATGTNISISDSNSLILGTIRSNPLTVNLPGGALTQSPGTNIVASGVANFTTSGNVALSNATNNFETVTASGANITISDADNVNIGSIQSTGNLTITSVGTTNLSANITTTGDQLFNRPVILTNNVTLRTTANGNATFASTLNGAYTLTANLGLGSLINLGTVGSCTTLNLASVGSISGSDLNLTIAPGAVIGSITGSGSNNTITVQSLSNQTSNIVISGTNSGNITSSGGTSVGSFTGITRIVGGAGSDTFKLVNNSALLNGTIDGGSGTNALNYSGTTKPTFINLGTGQATGVTSTTSTGVVTNIQNVFGGTGNDFLTGSAASNVMDGGAGDDTMSGLGGNDIMAGNYGADNMNGGAGIDILIGGYVDFVVGNLQEGLESIMSTWNNVTDGTFNAVSNTLGTASSTQFRLVGDTNLASTYLLQTVFNDQATDRLTDIASSTTPNWFFATERVTRGNDLVSAGTTFTVSKKTVTSKTGRTAR